MRRVHTHVVVSVGPVCVCGVEGVVTSCETRGHGGKRNWNFFLSTNGRATWSLPPCCIASRSRSLLRIAPAADSPSGRSELISFLSALISFCCASHAFICRATRSPFWSRKVR